MNQANRDAFKQRLSSFAQRAGGSSSIGHSPDSQSAPRVSTLSTKTWGKVRDQFATIPRRRPPSLASDDTVESIMEQLIFQAGVDFDTRPMVVVCASALPNPSSTALSYDALLYHILKYLDHFVESDYTVVLFAAGSTHQPSWPWLWKAYRSLDRNYRKNLKRLIVVHSNRFSRLLFSLAGSVISPKFFQKIVYVSTLSGLATYVPITQIAIPPEVYQENLKYESEIKLLSTQRLGVFGVPLEKLMVGDSDELVSLPKVIVDSIAFIKIAGLKTQGIFRRSPSSALLRQVADAYDRGHPVHLETYRDPHIAAVLIKKFLRDLPRPVFPETTYRCIHRCPVVLQGSDPEESINYICQILLPSLESTLTVLLLGVVLNLLHEVSLHSADNLMDSRNLATVLAPNLLAGSNPIFDVQMCAIPKPTAVPPLTSGVQAGGGFAMSGSTLASVLQICIDNHGKIFGDGVNSVDEWERYSGDALYGILERYNCKAMPETSTPATAGEFTRHNFVVNRKTTPIKRADGEAFSRQDIQYDLLNYIFLDDSKVFTDQNLQSKVSFGELYVNSLVRSSKCSKALRDKMSESRPFALDFAKLALLANVGRINSTQAFFPEMRTALRTYHPIPSLQHTDGNLQDAPRIKSCLKGCALPDEADGTTPSSLDEILAHVRSGKRPSTNVVNLVFILSNYSSDVASHHFPGTLGLEFLDLFLPVPVPSAKRARTFLWLMYNYLEGNHDNPYDDKYSMTHPGRSPYLYRVEPKVVTKENVDTLAEITWGQKMASRRAAFIEKQLELEIKGKEALNNPRHESKEKGSAQRKEQDENINQVTTRQGSKITAGATRLTSQPGVRRYDLQIRQMWQANFASHGAKVTAPHTLTGGAAPSMLEYAWKTGFQRDPVVDSDDEDADESCKIDYERRVLVLDRILGRERGSLIE